VTIDEGHRTIHENESVLRAHRQHPSPGPIPGKIPLELIEVQVGSYLGEDDIVRQEDVLRPDVDAPLSDAWNLFKTTGAGLLANGKAMVSGSDSLIVTSVISRSGPHRAGLV